MKQSAQLFSGLTDDAFEKHRKGLILSLEEEGDSIAEVAEELYDYATAEKGNFQFHEQLVEALKQLKKEEVVREARRILLDPETSRTIVMIRAEGNKEATPEGALTTVAQIRQSKAKRMPKNDRIPVFEKM
ncbi:MAG: hypothetical protein GTO40_30850 [Deltaproteobacteria bacterium]|nr:hypothetical protein [Deltaproteobacteria bacterium]